MVIVALAGVFSQAPFRVEGDIGYLAKSAHQFVNGQSSLHHLRLVDPADLSRDHEAWIFWWPPAISMAFAILFSTGLSIAESARVLTLMAVVSGVLGWSIVAGRLFDRMVTVIVASLVPLAWVIGMQGFQAFVTGDIIVFGLLPWTVISLAPLIDDKPPRHVAFACFGFGLGVLYWIKYSSLFLSVSVLIGLFFHKATTRRTDPALMVQALLAAGGFIVPLAALYWINLQAGAELDQLLVQRQANAVRQVGAEALISFASVVLPVEGGVTRFVAAEAPRWVLRGLGVFLSCAVIAAGFRMRDRLVGPLGLAFVFVPLAGLAYITLGSSHSFVLDASRHAGPAWVLLQVVLAGIVLRDPVTLTIPLELRRWLTASTCLLLFFAAYPLYAAARTSLAAIGRAPEAATGLDIRTLSTESGAEVQAAVSGLLLPDDVVVPATYWLGMESWLPLSNRLLPMTHFAEPVHHLQGLEGADYFGSGPFHTSQPVRVAMIVSDPYESPEIDANVRRIQARFPGARGWDEKLWMPRDRVRVWTAWIDPLPHGRHERVSEKPYR